MRPCVLLGAGWLALACGGTVEPLPAPGGPAVLEGGGQTGGETPPECLPTTPASALGFDQPSPLGFSAQQVLAGVGASVVHAATLTWDDTQQQTSLQVTVSAGKTFGYAATCKQNELDVLIAVQSADGAFRESFQGRAFARSTSGLTVEVSVPSASLAGAWSAQHALVPPPVTLRFYLELADAGVSGRVTGSAASGAPLAIAHF